MQIAGPQAIRALAQSLADDDPMVRSAAAAELHVLSDTELGAIAGDMAKLPPTSQVAVLAAIRIRGHSALSPAVLAVAKSPHESVRLAAARTLSTVGDVTALPTLVELVAERGPGRSDGPAKPGERFTDPRSTSRFSRPCGRRRTQSAAPPGSACSKHGNRPALCHC